jgi:hypothetical protein
MALMQVTENALELSKDTYGNYVIQHSLAYGTFDQKCEPPARKLFVRVVPQGHASGVA